MPRPAALQLSLALILSTAVTSTAVTLYQVDDFSSGTAGWLEGDVSPNPPVVEDTGLVGGGYLRNDSLGGGGAGGRLVMWNDEQWTGDYIGAGIVAIQFDALSTGDQPVDFRFAFNGEGGWFYSPAIRIDDFASGPDLTLFTLPITSADLLHASGGSGIYADTMSAVTRMEILTATGIPSVGRSPDVLRGDRLEGTLFVDNITAIPEPGTGLLLLIASFAVGARRRR
ncbi:MAG: PEP-CTERM sorting domain-containing protein [Verrucomicrobiales bacterium]